MFTVDFSGDEGKKEYKQDDLCELSGPRKNKEKMIFFPSRRVTFFPCKYFQSCAPACITWTPSFPLCRPAAWPAACITWTPSFPLCRLACCLYYLNAIIPPLPPRILAVLHDLSRLFLCFVPACYKLWLYHCQDIPDPELSVLCTCGRSVSFWYGSRSSKKGLNTRKIFKKRWNTLITHVLWVFTITCLQIII